MNSKCCNYIQMVEYSKVNVKLADAQLKKTENSCQK